MAITLGAFVLPATMVWEDEFAWSPVAQTIEYGLTGSQIIDEAVKQAGRPITLIGQSDGNHHTGGIQRADLLTLRTTLYVVGAIHTLTLHDARTFTVTSVHGGEGPITAVPLPVFGSIWPANPQSTRWYLLRAIRLITV
mgnify:CR=1 FL=1